MTEQLQKLFCCHQKSDKFQEEFNEFLEKRGVENALLAFGSKESDEDFASVMTYQCGPLRAMRFVSIMLDAIVNYVAEQTEQTELENLESFSTNMDLVLEHVIKLKNYELNPLIKKLRSDGDESPNNKI